MTQQDDGSNSHERLLRCASLYTGLPSSVFHREQEKGKKPQLTGGPELHFSVSHSGKWWACAFGCREVGLDIQQHRPCRAEALAKRFFHPNEVLWLESQNFSQDSFYRLWAAKESYVKLSGRGFGEGFSDFSLAPPHPARPHWRVVPFEPDYTLCLCANQIDQITLKKIEL